MTEQLPPLAAGRPLVITYSAFEVSPAAFDEIAGILRARGYNHVFDVKTGAIIMDQIALTRGAPRLTAADLAPKPGSPWG